ncbi:MAG TPA: TRAP transporter small permease [Candidatus Hydrogenedentes bacterium]|nr:TRAP transporter small permease [Candidatus Hydrogenedentota bacterium]HPG69655.1 TRAP transporter small permease [Candidatus Hydrogenedentota bacterium]
MSGTRQLAATARTAYRGYEKAVTAVVLLLSVVAGLGVLTMMVVTCLDVILRLFGSPLIGAYDIVRLAGAVTIACALPYTTAVKGHVAIEFFFQMLSRRGRILVDTLARSIGMGLFGLLAWQSVVYGNGIKSSGQVTATLQIPLFWLPYVLALCCGVVVLVIFHNLMHPGREMIKP